MLGWQAAGGPVGRMVSVVATAVGRRSKWPGRLGRTEFDTIYRQLAARLRCPPSPRPASDGSDGSAGGGVRLYSPSQCWTAAASTKPRLVRRPRRCG